MGPRLGIGGVVVGVVGFEDVFCGVGGHGFWGLDLRDGEGAAFGDVEVEGEAVAVGVAFGRAF